MFIQGNVVLQDQYVHLVSRVINNNTHKLNVTSFK